MPRLRLSSSRSFSGSVRCVVDSTAAVSCPPITALAMIPNLSFTQGVRGNETLATFTASPNANPSATTDYCAMVLIGRHTVALSDRTPLYCHRTLTIPHPRFWRDVCLPIYGASLGVVRYPMLAC
jgi:hypothetical protein